MKKSLSISIVIIITAALFSACGGGAPVKPQQKVIKKEAPEIRFALSDIAPKMKIFGTGQNFYGVVTPGQSWQSAGNPPHWLVFDGKGDFEGMAFKGLFNISRINIYVKKGEQYVDKIVLTNIDLTNGAIRTRLSPDAARPSAPLGDRATNLVSATRLKIEFEGTNAVVSNITIFGLLDEKKDYSAAKDYKQSDEEKKILSRSSLLFENKKYKDAIEMNEKALKLNPENPYPFMNLGQIYQTVAEKSEEHNAYLKIMSDSLVNYTAADRPDNPGRMELVQREAVIYQNNLLDSAKAREKWDDYISMMEENGKYDGNKMASILAGGIVSYQKNSDPALEAKMEKIMSLVNNGEVSGKNSDVYGALIFYIRYLENEKRDYEKVASIANILIKDFKAMEAFEHPYGYEHLGIANMALGRWQDAIEAWKGYVNKATDKNKFYPIAYCYLKIEDIDKALKYYTIGVGINNSTLYDKYYNQYKNKNNDERIILIRQNLQNDGLISKNDNEIYIDLSKKANEILSKYNINLK